MNKLTILATGTDFLKRQVRGTGPAIEEILADAKDEIQIMAYMISKNAVAFMDIIESKLESGKRTTIVINKLATQDSDVVTRLESWRHRFPTHFTLVDFSRDDKTLHAKVIVTDRSKAVIGSANFTWGGLSGNYEIGVLVEGNKAWELADLVDDVASSSEH